MARLFSLGAVVPGVCTHTASWLLYPRKDFAVPELSSSSQCAWITGSQLVFIVSGWNAFFPWIASHWRSVVSVKLGMFFHVFCCGCYYNIFRQQIPCSFLERFPKCYFWHLYFLQRANVIEVVGLASTFSQITALSFPTVGTGRGELYWKSRE